MKESLRGLSGRDAWLGDKERRLLKPASQGFWASPLHCALLDRTKGLTGCGLIKACQPLSSACCRSTPISEESSGDSRAPPLWYLFASVDLGSPEFTEVFLTPPLLWLLRPLITPGFSQAPPRIPSCKRNNKPHLCPCSGGNMTWCFWNSGTVTRTLRFKFRFRIQLILSTREGKRAKTEGKYPYGQSCLYLFQNKLSWIPEFTCCESVSGLWHAPWCVKYTWWGCCLQKWEVILRDLGKR